MSKNLENKKKIVDDTVALLDKASPSTLILDYSSISANEMNELRNKLFEKGANLKIIKNTLIRRVLNSVGVKLDKSNVDLTGQSAMLIANEDFVSTLKDVFNFIKESQKGNVKFAVLDGQLLESDKVKELSKLPSKDELLGQVVGGLISPIRGLAFALNDTQSKFVRVLSAIKDNK